VFSETVARFLIDRLGSVAYFALAAALLLVVPAALAWLVVVNLVRSTRGPMYGIAVGLVIAVWVSLCDLSIPYCGIYPNLLGALLGWGFAGPGADGTVVGQICIYGANLIVWPLFGWLAFRHGSRKNRSTRDRTDPGQP
jgi:hypothetical protein